MIAMAAERIRTYPPSLDTDILGLIGSQLIAITAEQFVTVLKFLRIESDGDPARDYILTLKKEFTFGSRQSEIRRHDPTGQSTPVKDSSFIGLVGKTLERVALSGGGLRIVFGGGEYLAVDFAAMDFEPIELMCVISTGGEKRMEFYYVL
jgi:hypothetical protein